MNERKPETTLKLKANLKIYLRDNEEKKPSLEQITAQIAKENNKDDLEECLLLIRGKLFPLIENDKRAFEGGVLGTLAASMILALARNNPLPIPLGGIFGGLGGAVTQHLIHKLEYPEFDKLFAQKSALQTIKVHLTSRIQTLNQPIQQEENVEPSPTPGGLRSRRRLS